MEAAVGIDLGTTYSVVAHMDKDGRCRTVPNADGDLTTPSVVFFDQDGHVVGKEAVKAAIHDPSRVAQFAKRDMGKAEFSESIVGQSLPPEVIQALILGKLRDDAALMIGPFSKVVVTVPAYFNEPRRKATQDAGRLAGLDVLDIINEPTAAAIAYGVQEGFLDDEGAAREKEVILVYDLGGGTFDATLMEIEGRRYRAIATAGDVYLGGIDWDTRILDCLAMEFRKQYGLDPRNDDRALLELRREAEEAKRSLSFRNSVTAHLSFKDRRHKVELTRDLFKELTEELTSRTIFTCAKLIKEAELGWDDVTRVLLVGGSSRMTTVQEALESASGKTVDRSLAPDEAVAHGAAIYAQILLSVEDGQRPQLKVTNVNSHDLGVLGVERETGMRRRRILIPRNSPLPATGRGKFTIRQDNQSDVVIDVVEGGDAGGNNATPIGRFVVDKIPPDTPAGTPVKVRFSYSTDGRLHVDASLAGVEDSTSMSVDRATGLTEEQLETWRGKIEAKTLIEEPASAETVQEFEGLLEPDELDTLDELGEAPEGDDSADPMTEVADDDAPVWPVEAEGGEESAEPTEVADDDEDLQSFLQGLE